MVKIIGIDDVLFQFQFGVTNLPLFSPAEIYAPTKTSICSKVWKNRDKMDSLPGVIADSIHQRNITMIV